MFFLHFLTHACLELLHCVVAVKAVVVVIVVVVVVFEVGGCD